MVLRHENNVWEPFAGMDLPSYVPDEPLGWPGKIRHVTHAVERFRPDLLHTSLFEADVAGRIAAWRLGLPVLTSLVNMPYGDEARSVETVSPVKLRAVQTVDALLSRYATTALHAISRSAAEHATVHLGVPRRRIRVVPRGRSSRELGDRADARRRRVRDGEGWHDRPVVINVARQEPQKGQAHLLAAWPRVLQHHPDALLVIVGREGRSTVSLREMLASSALDASVRFTGARRDVPDLVAAADVFAFSSLYEGLGGAVVEAAGIGTPIVSFDIPAVVEVVGAGYPWLVPAASADRLAAAIVDALADEDRANALAAQVRRRFEQRFELEVAVDGMLDLYGDLQAALPTLPSSRLRRVPQLEAWS